MDRINASRAAALLILACACAPLSARNEALMFPIADVTRQASTKQMVGTDMRLQFGALTAEAKSGAELLGEVVARGVADPYEGHGSKRESRGDEVSCREAFRKTLAELSRQARGRGANAVLGIVSFYNHVEMNNPSAYECHAGMSRVVVELKAQAARVLPANASASADGAASKAAR
jgi:uncharacterized protein YbjQ (UPF0145 family)